MAGIMWDFYVDGPIGILQQQEILDAFRQPIGGKGYFTTGEIQYIFEKNGVYPPASMSPVDLNNKLWSAVDINIEFTQEPRYLRTRIVIRSHEFLVPDVEPFVAVHEKMINRLSINQKIEFNINPPRLSTGRRRVTCHLTSNYKSAQVECGNLVDIDDDRYTCNEVRDLDLIKLQLEHLPLPLSYIVTEVNYPMAKVMRLMDVIFYDRPEAQPELIINLREAEYSPLRYTTLQNLERYHNTSIRIAENSVYGIRVPSDSAIYKDPNSPEKVYLSTARSGGKSSYINDFFKKFNDGERMHIEFDEKATDLLKEMQKMKNEQLIKEGHLTPNEIRAQFGLPPILDFSGKERTHMAFDVKASEKYLKEIEKMAKERGYLTTDDLMGVPSLYHGGWTFPRLTTDMIEKVIFDSPKTIVLWKDGTKTEASCSENDTFNERLGLMICIVKHVQGKQSKTQFNKTIDKLIAEADHPALKKQNKKELKELKKQLKDLEEEKANRRSTADTKGINTEIKALKFKIDHLKKEMSPNESK